MARVLEQAAVQLAGLQAVALRMLRRASQLVSAPHGRIGRPVPIGCPNQHTTMGLRSADHCSLRFL